MSGAVDVRRDDEGRPTHKNDGTGQFAPGNKWMMPRWQPGESGRPAKYSPTKLWYAVKDYVEQWDTIQHTRIANGLEPQRLTWAGLAAHLGITRQSLDSYAQGEIGKTEEDRAGVSAVLAQYRTLMEAELEHRLTSKAYATQGVIFALKNQAGWRDEKHLSVQSEVKQALIVQLPADLAAQLEQQRGESLGVIEGECEVKSE